MNRCMLEKICDPHISILNNISILKENWLRRRDIDKAKLYIHPTTYDKLMFEIATKPQPWVYEALRYGETILGLPIIQDQRVRPYHLLIKEEDNMRKKYIIDESDIISIEGRACDEPPIITARLREYNIDYLDDSIDSYRYAIGGRGAGKTYKTLNSLPKKYILNQDACILFWNNKDKTIVKKAEDDIQDPVKGFLWAYFLKHSGLTRTKANKYLREIDEAYKEITKED